MQKERKRRLERNFGLMFWIRALTEIKVINVISTIFMVHRGLTLSQVITTAMAFALVSVLTEVPSSYLADKWSRKGLIMISLVLGMMSWAMQIFAWGFWPFIAAISMFSLAYSLMSGTDEAIVYDTSRELGEDGQSMKQLGKFYAGQRIFKIFTPMVAVLIASKLTEWQFIYLLLIDVVAHMLAMVLAMEVVEPKQHYAEEKVESGIFKDSVNLIRTNPSLGSMIANRTLMFMAAFIVWRISSQYFNSLGVAIFWLGMTTSFYQVATFVLNIKSHVWFKNISSETFVNRMNILCTLFLGLFAINQMTLKNPWLAMILFALVNITEVIRWPFFADITNKLSKSFNRATTISLTNLFNSWLQLPFLWIGAVLVAQGYTSLFLMTFGVGVCVCLIFPLRK